MAEAVVRRAVEPFLQRDLPAPVAVTSRHITTEPFSSYAAGSGAPVDQIYWLGAQVEAAKIRFFGFFRTEQDALDAVT